MVAGKTHIVERVQTGVRMEKRVLKVLKAFADYRDLTLGGLLEGIVLHDFDGKWPFDRDGLRRITELKTFYGLDLDSSSSHRLIEADSQKAVSQQRKGCGAHLQGCQEPARAALRFARVPQKKEKTPK